MQKIKQLSLSPEEEQKRLSGLYKYEKVKLREQTRDNWRRLKKETAEENLLISRLAIGSLEKEEYCKKKQELWDTISSSSSDSSLDSTIGTTPSHQHMTAANPKEALQVKDDQSCNNLSDTTESVTESPVPSNAVTPTRPKKPWGQLVKDIEMKYHGNAYDKIEYPFNGEFMARFEKIKSCNLSVEEENERLYNLYRYQITQIEAEYGNMDFSQEKKKLKKFLAINPKNVSVSKMKKTASGVKNTFMLKISRLGNLRL